MIKKRRAIKKMENISKIDDNLKALYKNKKELEIEFTKTQSALIEEMIEEQKLPLKERVESLKNKHNNVSMEIETLEEEESLVGPRKRKLTESCKKLGINPAIYHGGDLEGKAVQTMLNCARNLYKFELFEYLEDKADEREKYVRALSTLAKVSDALKTPFDDPFDNEDV